MLFQCSGVVNDPHKPIILDHGSTKLMKPDQGTLLNMGKHQKMSIETRKPFFHLGNSESQSSRVSETTRAETCSRSVWPNLENLEYRINVFIRFEIFHLDGTGWKSIGKCWET